MVLMGIGIIIGRNFSRIFVRMAGRHVDMFGDRMRTDPCSPWA
jgi:hypothetical protein